MPNKPPNLARDARSLRKLASRPASIRQPAYEHLRLNEIAAHLEWAATLIDDRTRALEESAVILRQLADSLERSAVTLPADLTRIVAVVSRLDDDGRPVPGATVELRFEPTEE